jgi:hypothetical protein
MKPNWYNENTRAIGFDVGKKRGTGRLETISHVPRRDRRLFAQQQHLQTLLSEEQAAKIQVAPRKAEVAQVPKKPAPAPPVKIRHVDYKAAFDLIGGVEGKTANQIMFQLQINGLPVPVSRGALQAALRKEGYRTRDGAGCNPWNEDGYGAEYTLGRGHVSLPTKLENPQADSESHNEQVYNTDEKVCNSFKEASQEEVGSRCSSNEQCSSGSQGVEVAYHKEPARSCCVQDVR